jgi:hypothetical protein
VLVPGSNASTHSLRCNIKKQRSFYYIAWSINYIMKLYNTCSIKRSEFTKKSKIAWSPSSSCATDEHAADRRVTLSYLSYHQNLQHETLQPQRVNTLELYWQDVIVWWTQMEPNTKMNIWLGEASGLSWVKQLLSYHFLKAKLLMDNLTWVTYPCSHMP